MNRSPARPTLTGSAAVNPSVLSEASSLGAIKPSSGLISRAWHWIRSRQLRRANPGRLQVAETVSLGEKRFVAVVQVDGRHFLLAGGPANIALLAQLDEKEPFADVLQKTMTVAEKPAAPNKPRKAPVVAAPPPLPRRARPAPGKQGAKASANKTANALTAARSSLAAETAFAKVLGTAIATAGKPPAKTARKRTTPPARNSRQAIYDTGREKKTIAARKKAAAGPVAASAAVNVAPAPAEENFEQWLLQAALRRQSSKKLAPQAGSHSAAKPSFSAAEPMLDPLSDPLLDARSSPVPLPPRSNTVTIEEYA